MFQDTTAFLEYPSLHLQGSFDLVRMDFYPYRVRGQMDMSIFNSGREVAKFNLHVPTERLYEQYGLEQIFAERCSDNKVRYEINIHGTFPENQQN